VTRRTTICRHRFVLLAGTLHGHVLCQHAAFTVQTSQHDSTDGGSALQHLSTCCCQVRTASGVSGRRGRRRSGLAGNMTRIITTKCTSAAAAGSVGLAAGVAGSAPADPAATLPSAGTGSSSWPAHCMATSAVSMPHSPYKHHSTLRRMVEVHYNT